MSPSNAEHFGCPVEVITLEMIYSYERSEMEGARDYYSCGHLK